MTKRATRITEAMVKQQVVDYLSIRGFFSFPLRAGLGSYKGLPDRIAHINGEVVYLEIKKPGGKLSEHQRDFQEQCDRDRIHYFVIHNLEELIERIGG